ncbi:hypothetical protein [Bacillus cereus]|uniref:hypothetical protein n=1 Tax=Bacillus cereus TaxID=1396 RepID=UPI003CFD9F88
MVEDIINNLVSYPTLHAIKIRKGSFNNYEHYKVFLANASKFKNRLQHYFALYCHKNGFASKLKEEYISIRGYYVEKKNFLVCLEGEELITIYAELKPVTNKDSVAGLYHWEDKLNELRTDVNTNGL